MMFRNMADLKNLKVTQYEQQTTETATTHPQNNLIKINIGLELQSLLLRKPSWTTQVISCQYRRNNTLYIQMRYMHHGRNRYQKAASCTHTPMTQANVLHGSESEDEWRSAKRKIKTQLDGGADSCEEGYNV